MTHTSLSKTVFIVIFCVVALALVSCRKEKYKRIHPLFLTAFNVMAESSFVLIDQSQNDSIIFNVSSPQFNYEELLYSNVVLENYSLAASTSLSNGSKMQIIITINSNNYISILLDFALHKGSVPSPNDSNGFLLAFNDTVTINGIEFDGVLTNVSNYSSMGQLSSVEFSPTYGVLRIVSQENGAVYVRCFECD